MKKGILALSAVLALCMFSACSTQKSGTTTENSYTLPVKTTKKVQKQEKSFFNQLTDDLIKDYVKKKEGKKRPEGIIKFP